MDKDAALKALRELAGGRGMLSGADVEERYLGDVLGNRGEPPLAVLRPTSTAEVSAMLRICHEAGMPVVTQGGRTGLALGALPREGEIVLSLERMTAIEAVDADAGTARVQAGVILQALQDRIEPLALTFPLDLGARGSCTIGGNISTNAGGNRVIRYGMSRDLVIGLEAVLADGTVLDGLKPLLKNNTGPDLKQMFIGSEGTLGVVTRAVLRLFPLPADRTVAMCAATDFGHVKALLRHCRAGLGGELTAFEVMWDSYFSRAASLLDRAPPILPGYPFYVLVEASGAERAALAANVERTLYGAVEQNIVVDAVVAKSGAENGELWRVRDMPIEVSRMLLPLVPFDVGVAIADMEDFVADLERTVRAIDARCETICFGHVGDGNLHIGVHQPPDRPETFVPIEHAVYELVGRYSGSISAEHGIGWLKREFLSYSRSPQEIDAMRRLKAAFDPKGILNRGRILQ